MSNFQYSLNRCVFSIVLLAAFCLTISAQTTIFNIPSTDTVERKTFYVEADYTTHFDSFRTTGFRSGGYRVVYGARRNLEVGLNFFHTQTGSSQQTELQPNIKWRFFANEKHKIAASAGAIVFIPLNRQTGKRPITLVFSNFSKGIKFAGGMRLTAGFYKIANAEKSFGAKNGAILGFEKPIIKKLSFITDWYSGKNRFGYTATGLNLQITNRQLLTGGYNFGNSGRANNFLTVFYGYTF